MGAQWRLSRASSMAGHGVAQVETGQPKRAVVAWEGRHPLAVGVYQADLNDPTKVEIKHYFVERSARRLGLGVRLLVEIEGAIRADFPQATTLVGDTKLTNVPLIDFARGHDFSLQGAAILDNGSFGHNGTADVILAKPLNPPQDLATIENTVFKREV